MPAVAKSVIEQPKSFPVLLGTENRIAAVLFAKRHAIVAMKPGFGKSGACMGLRQILPGIPFHIESVP